MLNSSGDIVNIADLLAFIVGGAGYVKPTNFLYVGKNGNDTTGDGSANLPFITVQKAIDTAASGTTVYIWPGTYAESLTFKAGVYLASPVPYGVYITGNHTANFAGTVIIGDMVLNSTSGDTLTFSGTGAQTLQLLRASINATTGHAVNWTNTNTASKIIAEDSSSTVTTSGASARCFYSSSVAKGIVLANRYSFKVDNPNNVCLAIGGAINFTHTSDQVIGQVSVADTAVYIGALVALTTTSIAAFTTTSSGVSVLSSVPITTTASPAITGTGGFAYVAIEYLSTGVGGVATLNGGLGAQPLTMAPIRLRAASLLPSAAVSAGLLGGTFEYDGTNLYFTTGTTRKTVTLT
jgi:hypothetical protein